jgi:hypothetical protein
VSARAVDVNIDKAWSCRQTAPIAPGRSRGYRDFIFWADRDDSLVFDEDDGVWNFPKGSECSGDMECFDWHRGIMLPEALRDAPALHAN